MMSNQITTRLFSARQAYRSPGAGARAVKSVEPQSVARTRTNLIISSPAPARGDQAGSFC